jgi:DNA polymerase-3 subunit alpha
MDFEEQAVQEQPRYPQNGTLWLKLSGESDPNYRKVRAIVNMFPGTNPVKVFFADTRKIRVAQATLDDRMLRELEHVLGEGNVVVK